MRLLAALAHELSETAGPDSKVRARRTIRFTPSLSLRTQGGEQLHVYCISEGGRDALLTGDGDLIRLDEGVGEAARQLARTCRAMTPAALAAQPSAAERPGP